MKILKFAFVVFFCLFGFQVVAQEEGALLESKNMSFARRLALYTELTGKSGPLIDAEEGDFKEVFSRASDHSIVNAANSALDTTVALKALLAPSKLFGYSPVLFLLSNKQLAHPALMPQIIAWMPAEVAKDGEMAVRVMREKLFDAFTKSIPLPYSYVVYEVASKPIFGREYTENFISLVGPGCPSEDGLECRVGIGIKKPMKTSSPPDWVGGSGEYYYWKNWKDGATYSESSIGVGVFMAKPGKSHSERPSGWWVNNKDRLLSEMSKHLDSWIYVYLSPSIQRPYPVVFNQGKPNYFVKSNVQPQLQELSAPEK